MNCPQCAMEMIKAKATNFGEEYDYCRTCKKELSEMVPKLGLKIEDANWKPGQIVHISPHINIAPAKLQTSPFVRDQVIASRVDLPTEFTRHFLYVIKDILPDPNCASGHRVYVKSDDSGRENSMCGSCFMARPSMAIHLRVGDKLKCVVSDEIVEVISIYKITGMFNLKRVRDGLCWQIDSQELDTYYLFEYGAASPSAAQP